MPIASKLEPGKLRHRIEIVKPSGTQDEFGGVTSDPADWTKVLECWASIEAMSARDQFASGTFVTSATHKITIRHPRDLAVIKSSMQVWFKGRTFIIQGVLNPDETNKMLTLNVLEIEDSTNQQKSPNAGTLA